jgi:hypothetical protein
MSGDNNPPIPQWPSILELAAKLLIDLDAFTEAPLDGAWQQIHASSQSGQGEALFGSIEALRSALRTIEPRAYEPWSREAEAWVDLAYHQPPEPMRSEGLRYTRATMVAAYMAGRFAQSRTRPGPIDDIELALEGIALIKRNAPPGELRPEHVLAVVKAAEHVLEQDAGYGLRQDADRRAIERWQAGAPHPDVEALIVAARAVFDGMDKATAASVPAQRLGQAIVKAHTGINTPTVRRALIWPDHADLVVWLLELVTRRPDVPALQEVERVRDRLRTAIVASGGNALAVDSKKMIDALVQLALWADRRAYMAERALAARDGERPAGMNGRVHLLPPAADHGHVDRRKPWVKPAIRKIDTGDDGLGSRVQSFGGGDVPGPAEGPCGHYPIAQISGCEDAITGGEGGEDQRRALESQVNGYLANLASNIGVTQARDYVSSTVATIAPGWEYAEITKLADEAPQIALTIYDPDSPL